jgi:hypothetical protein
MVTPNEKTPPTKNADETTEAHADNEPGSDETVIRVSTAAPEHATEEIDQIRENIAAIEQRISDLVEGNEQWKTTTITSLQQQIADLKVNLSTVAEQLPEQVKELRGELILLSREIRERLATPPVPEVAPASEVVNPQEVVPDLQAPTKESEEGTPESVHAQNAPQNAMESQFPHATIRRKPRVI